MKKTILLFFLALAGLLVLITCTKKHEQPKWKNPLDPDGANWHPPTVLVADTTVAVKDTVILHASAASANSRIVKFKWVLDGITLPDTLAFMKKSFAIKDTGLHVIIIVSKDSNGLFSKPDTGTVLVLSYRPIVQGMADTIIPVNQVSTLHALGKDTNPLKNDSVSMYFWADDGQNYKIDTVSPGQHQVLYSTIGKKTVLVKVRDRDSLFSAADTIIVDVRDNKPHNLLPADSSIVRKDLAVLSWSPQLFRDHYQILMDGNNPPTTVLPAAIADTFYAVSALVQVGQSYYWRARAFNSIGQSADGDVWKLTINMIPTAIIMVAPLSGIITDTFRVDADSSYNKETSRANLQVQWQWENGGAWTAWTLTKTATHLYPRPGVKTIKLQVQDQDGLIGIDSVQVTVVNRPPNATFTVLPAVGDSIGVMFNVDASGCTDLEDSTAVLQVRWDWENTGAWTSWTTTKTATHYFTSAGTKTIRLQVMDTNDSVATTTRQVMVKDRPPVAVFTVAPDSGILTTVFNVDASGAHDLEDAAGLLQVQWQWENGGTWTAWSTTKTASHTYTTDGTKTITMRVQDTNDSVAALSQTITIKNTAPLAHFTVTPPYGDAQTKFILDASSSSDLEDSTKLLQVRWDFTNDGTWDRAFTTAKICTVSYATWGRYTVRLQVMDTQGLTGDSTVQILVADRPPTASFTVTPATGNDITQVFSVDASGCTDLESPTDSLQVRWDWESTGAWTAYTTVKTATHQYPKPGVKTITLEVMDNCDSVRTTTRQVSITDKPPVASFTVTPASGLITTTFSVDASGSSDLEDQLSDLQVQWKWDTTGAWSGWTTTKTTTHQYATPGVKTIWLQVKDLNDSVSTTTRQVVVNNQTPTAAFTVAPNSGLVTTSFSVDASGSSDLEDAAGLLQVRWDWENTGAWTSWTTTKTATHTFPTVGLKTIRLQVMDTGDSIGTTTQQVTINNTAPTASFTAAPFYGTLDTLYRVDASACTDLEDATALLQVQWDWESTGAWTAYTTVKTATHLFATAGGKTITLQVKDTQGATTTATKYVIAAPSGGPTGMHYIPAGTFAMGSNSGGTEETPVHTVSVSAFWIDTVQVRQLDYIQLLGQNPSNDYGNNYPVELITWYDAALYCNARSLRDGLDTVYSYTGASGIAGNGCVLSGVVGDLSKLGYRLPTEAEWEYACRAGTTTKYYFGDSTTYINNYAWYASNSGNVSHTVGQKLPNQFGLYDMSGNVFEWCNDWYDPNYYSVSPSSDPPGPATGTSMVLRGGSYKSTVDILRSAYRATSTPPNNRYMDVGFRVVRKAP